MWEYKICTFGDNKKETEYKMTFKELEEEIDDWGAENGISTITQVEKPYTCVYRLGEHDQVYLIAKVRNDIRAVFDIEWKAIEEIENLKEKAIVKLVKILFSFSLTKPSEREYEKRYIIPLPGLITTDGAQQYLTKNVSFFASRRDRRQRQTWKEEHLKFVPEIYRKYAVELEEEDDR